MLSAVWQWALRPRGRIVETMVLDGVETGGSDASPRAISGTRLLPLFGTHVAFSIL